MDDTTKITKHHHVSQMSVPSTDDWNVYQVQRSC